jgi:hypothetical protein
LQEIEGDKDKIKEGFTGIFCENWRPFQLAQDSVKWPVLLLWAVVEVLGTCGCNQITIEIKQLTKNQLFCY